MTHSSLILTGMLCSVKAFLSLFFSFYLSVPDELEDLVIPNPLTTKGIFYNQVLYEIYDPSYELLALIQFRSYVASQHIH